MRAGSVVCTRPTGVYLSGPSWALHAPETPQPVQPESSSSLSQRQTVDGPRGGCFAGTGTVVEGAGGRGGKGVPGRAATECKATAEGGAVRSWNRVGEVAGPVAVDQSLDAAGPRPLDSEGGSGLHGGPSPSAVWRRDETGRVGKGRDDLL